jgi:prolipoprotein diacylglyceryl transferase
VTTFLASFPSPPQGVWHWHLLGLSIPIRAYALFIIVGIIVALVIGDRRWVARGGEPGVVYDIALLAVPFGLIGGRLYHVMTDWRTYFGDDGAGILAALRIWEGGLGIWGAVALGGVGAWIGCRLRGIPLPAFGDAVAPGIVLAQAIGRLGNYFNQELYGRATSLPWGLKIYERRDASGAIDYLNGVSTGSLEGTVHPTFLYELIWNILVFALLIFADRRFKLGHGRLFALYVAAYCLGRFWIELLRDDTATLIAGIRINSFTSTFVFIGAVVYMMLAPKGREEPATLVGKHHQVTEKKPKPIKLEREIPAESEDAALVEWTKELAAVASATGVVAAVAVAAEDEDSESRQVDEAEPAGEGAAKAAATPTAQIPEDLVAERGPAQEGDGAAAAVEEKNLAEAEPAEAEAVDEEEAVGEEGVVPTSQRRSLLRPWASKRRSGGTPGDAKALGEEEAVAEADGEAVGVDEATPLPEELASAEVDGQSEEGSESAPEEVAEESAAAAAVEQTVSEPAEAVTAGEAEERAVEAGAEPSAEAEGEVAAVEEEGSTSEGEVVDVEAAREESAEGEPPEAVTAGVAQEDASEVEDEPVAADEAVEEAEEDAVEPEDASVEAEGPASDEDEVSTEKPGAAPAEAGEVDTEPEDSDGAQGADAELPDSALPTPVPVVDGEERNAARRRWRLPRFRSRTR